MNPNPAEVRVAQTNAVAQIVAAAIAKGLLVKEAVVPFTRSVAEAIKMDL